MASIINGKQLANQLIQCLSERVDQLKKQNISPSLAVVLVGEDPASQVYVRNKIRACTEVGIRSQQIHLTKDTDTECLLQVIHKLNTDDEIDGILVQLPLPKTIDSNQIINSIAYHKDVDGFHTLNIGKLAAGEPNIIPCTPLGCLLLIQQIETNLSGKQAVIVGRSNIVGKPMAHLLLQQNCSVSLIHSATINPASLSQQADILVAAVGQANLIKAEWVKPGAIVIDVGINPAPAELNRKLCGDVDFDQVADRASAITPVPGGVGPMTIACLMFNCLSCCYQRHQLQQQPLKSLLQQLSS